MKLALRYIPTEVWVDVFCYSWISRKKLGKLVDKLRNHKFAEILQYCLHERGKRMLNRLYLDKTNLETLPRTPMPENVKFFELIIIRYFDSQTLEFLRHINTLFLMNDVNLYLCNVGPRDDLTKLRTILGYLSPLLHGIHSLAFNQLAIPLVELNFGLKLAQVKMISLDLYSAPADPETVQAINFTMNWLISEGRDPSEPRLLKVSTCSENFQQFTMAVRQQFNSAKTPCTFAIGFNCCTYDNHHIADFHLENNLGEQLDGQFGEYGHFQIYRHKQVDSAREQMQEWVKGAVEKSDKSSGIQLYGFTTIGLDLITNRGERWRQDDNAGEDEADQAIRIEET